MESCSIQPGYRVKRNHDILAHRSAGNRLNQRAVYTGVIMIKAVSLAFYTSVAIASGQVATTETVESRSLFGSEKTLCQSTIEETTQTPAVVTAAQTGSVKPGLPKPNASNVACSNSLLTAAETRDIFGSKVARMYVPFQIVARNLNGESPFLLQDVQIALKGPSSQSEFIAGRDGKLVRDIAAKNGTDGPTGRVSRALSAAVSLGSAIGLAIGNPEFKDAMLVVQASLVPSYHALSRDDSSQNLNRLNDLAFSQSSPSKILIPPHGSVPFVSFIPIDLLSSRAGSGIISPLSLQRDVQVMIVGTHIIPATDRVPPMIESVSGEARPPDRATWRAPSTVAIWRTPILKS